MNLYGILKRFFRTFQTITVLELHFIHQEMGSLRTENQKQNLEITSLKETVQLQNKTISQHETTIKDLISNDHKMIKGDRDRYPLPSAATMSRRKRPARLLPDSILFGKKKNKTDEENRKIFYGPPTNCSDLTRLGYTLNGFYLVKSPGVDENFPQATILLSVYCAFKQEGIYYPGNVQKPAISPYSSFNSLPLPSFSPSFTPPDDISFYASVIRKKIVPSYGTITFQKEGTSYFEQHFNQTTGYFKPPKNGIYLKDFLHERRQCPQCQFLHER